MSNSRRDFFKTFGAGTVTLGLVAGLSSRPRIPFSFDRLAPLGVANSATMPIRPYGVRGLSGARTQTPFAQTLAVYAEWARTTTCVRRALW